jgi:hypothetical protein
MRLLPYFYSISGGGGGRDGWRLEHRLERKFDESGEEVCFRCKQSGHKAFECPLKEEKLCFICGESGHTAKDCRKCRLCLKLGHYAKDCPDQYIYVSEASRGLDYGRYGGRPYYDYDYAHGSSHSSGIIFIFI